MQVGPGPSSSAPQRADAPAPAPLATPKITSDPGRLLRQIRTFIEAAEYVDAEIQPETVEDLSAVLAANEKAQAQDGSDDDGSSDELDLSALYAVQEEESEPFTRDDIRRMLKYLKEHGMNAFAEHYVVHRNIPIPTLLQAFGINLCPELRILRRPTLMYFLKVAMAREVRLREKLPKHNTINDAVNLIRSSKRIIILTGAGISVSCGIPDFRSKDGIYASLDGKYELDDPQQMFDISYFRENPNVFYSFAHQIYPSNFIPSPCHRFIKLVEDKGKLLRNYTQNIDTLETLAGVQNVLQCHGSFATASCLQCRRRVPGSEIEIDILRHRVPLCPVCNAAPPVATPSPFTSAAASANGGKQTKKNKNKNPDRWDSDEEQGEDEPDAPEYPPGIMKPDITFFGEKLTDEFDRSVDKDRSVVDLLLVIGTSLKVAPVADIISHLPHSVPQILINKTPIRHINPDIVLLGNADDIVLHLTDKLGWQLPPPPPPRVAAEGNGRLYPPRNTKKRLSSESVNVEEPQRVVDSHVWLFPGAEGGRWLREFEAVLASENEEVGQNSVPGSRPSTSGTNTPDSRSMKKQKTEA